MQADLQKQTASEEVIKDIQFNEYFKKYDGVNDNELAKCFLLAYNELTYIKNKVKNLKPSLFEELSDMLLFEEIWINELRYFISKIEDSCVFQRKVSATLTMLGRQKIINVVYYYSQIKGSDLDFMK